MTAVIPEGLEPIAVWDAGPGWIDDVVNEKIAWARRHISRASRAYRVEFYALADGPYALVHRFAENGDGHVYTDRATGEPAREAPAVEDLAELPPPHLLASR